MGIERQIRELIAYNLGVSQDKLTLESDFFEDLYADELDHIELMIALEEKFGCDIPDEEANEINTVGQAIDYIKKHVNRSTPETPVRPKIPEIPPLQWSVKNSFTIPQTLIIPRETSFDDMCKTIESFGFTPAHLDKESMKASWSWGGELPILSFRHNPTVDLHLLDVSTAPPDIRSKIAKALSPLPPEAIRDALQNDDKISRLFGITAALETERTDLISDIRSLKDHISHTQPGLIEYAISRLEELAEAEIDMMISSQMLAESAIHLIRALRDVAVLHEMTPSKKDCFAIFHESIAGRVWEKLAETPPPQEGILCQPDGPEDITVLPAGGLRFQNKLSETFVRGYRVIAGWLEPSHLWIRWLGTEPSGGFKEMDGLVYESGRWLWMPKIFRIIEPLILRPH